MILALLLILCGLVALVASMGYGQQAPGTIARHRAAFPAPPWIGTCAGLGFLAGGVAVLLTQWKHQRMGNVAAGLAGAMICVVLGWLAMQGWQR